MPRKGKIETKIKHTKVKSKNKNERLILVSAAAAKSLQSCPTLCDPIDGSPSGSPPLGFSRPRILK